VFQPSDHDVGLSEEEFRLLRDFIHERFGLFFDNNQRASLRARLVGRLASLDLVSFEDYYEYLRFAPEREEELERMVSHLTNNETYFFREQPQLQVFADHVVRTLKERKGKEGSRQVRVLSAGCSSGEEAHTLAIILYDSGQFFWNWDVQIIGMDVDNAALEKARRGLYHHNSFRSMSRALFERHFVTEGNSAHPKEPIRRLVRMRSGNIVEGTAYEGVGPLDVIFCRNVFIYFSEAMILRAVRLFHQALVPGGYLFLGHAESLSRLTDLFTPIRFQGAMIYQKAPCPEAPGASRGGA
jgi:chemotaxis protein methyltransferase CheR